MRKIIIDKILTINNLLMKTIKLITLVLFIIIVGSCKKKETKTESNCPIAVIPDPTTVKDIDGNVYPIVKICGKFWMAENLRTTRYNDGLAIPTNLSNAAWGAMTTGAFSIYDSSMVTLNSAFGKLYNWYAASSSKLAPAGWHVATEVEWNELVTCLGGQAVAGGKMKTTTFWNTPNTGADNSSGFNALPSGYRNTSGMYSLIGNSAYFWASDERNSTQGEYLLLNNNFATTAQNGATKQFGNPVRCVRD